MEIRIDVLQVLLHKLASTSWIMPGRAEYITKEVQGYMINHNDVNTCVLVDLTLPNEEKIFSPTLENISSCIANIQIWHRSTRSW